MPTASFPWIVSLSSVLHLWIGRVWQMSLGTLANVKRVQCCLGFHMPVLLIRQVRGTSTMGNRTTFALTLCFPPNQGY